jgi:hypothetical protein
MSFKAAFIAHAPDADPDKHRTRLETGLYTLITVLARDQKQSLEICKELVREEGVQSIILCPGFSTLDAGEIAQAAGPGVAVAVSRVDTPGARVVREVMEREGWFSKASRA